MLLSLTQLQRKSKATRIFVVFLGTVEQNPLLYAFLFAIKINGKLNPEPGSENKTEVSARLWTTA